MADEDEEQVVVDSPDKTVEIDEALAFAKAMRLDSDHSGNTEIANRAQAEVGACLRQAEQGWSTRYTKYRKLLGLWNQESLSSNAKDMGVHMGAAFEKCEEWASKMYGAVFGQAGEYVGGDCEDLEDKDMAQSMVALVQEVMDNEACIREDGLEMLREAGIFGRYTAKIVPELEIKHTLSREVTSDETLDGKPVYRFAPVEEKEIARVRVRRYDVSPFDFRIPDTASSIEDADWCGDYSFPTPEWLRAKARAGDFNAEAVEEALAASERVAKDAETALGANARGGHRSLLGDKGRHEGDNPDHSLTAPAVCMFEWWGNFDLKGDGKRKPCVITMLLPADGDRPSFVGGRAEVGWVVRVTRNPYLMGHKPYVSIPVLPKHHKWDSPGVVELVGKHSYYEDEMAALALLGAYHEASPALQVSDAAGVDPSQLRGFLPGSTIDVEQLGQMEYLAAPQRAQGTLATMEFFSHKAAGVAGLGNNTPQPRVAAAADIRQAQEQDVRLMAYIQAVESHFIVPAAKMIYGYIQQFQTTERKVKILGMKAAKLGDMRTVKPTDLAMNLRFEPVVGKRLTQKSFQGQMAINMYDRCQMANMMGMQTGEGPRYKMAAIDEFIWGDIFGHPDPSRFLHEQVNPEDMRTVAEEHRLFAMGEKPTVQKGEAIQKHLMGHIDYLRSGATVDWSPERRQALVDHVYDTIDAFMRQVEQATPAVAEQVRALFDQQLEQAGVGPSTEARDKPGQSMMPGGGQRGFAGAGAQQADSPKFRPERMPGVQSSSMAQTYNGGAQ